MTICVDRLRVARAGVCRIASVISPQAIHYASPIDTPDSIPQATV